GCEFKPKNMFEKVVGGDQTMTDIIGGAASKGRTCWAVWPVLADPADPTSKWAHQPALDVQPFCYTSSAAPPKFEPPNSIIYTPSPYHGKVTFPYVPDAQGILDVFALDANTNVGSTLLHAELSDLCPQVGPQFHDIYDCEVPLNFTYKDPGNYVFHAIVRTWNSDKFPAERPPEEQMQKADYDFIIPHCGKKDEGCCVNQPCETAGLVCSASKTCVTCGSQGSP